MIDARSPHQRLSLRPATRPANRLAVWLMAAMLLTVVGCAKQQPTPPPAPPEPAVLTGTRATSNTSVIATFDRPVGAGATDVGLYTIAVRGGGTLEVVAAYPRADGLSVALATAPQAEVDYRLAAPEVPAATPAAAATGNIPSAAATDAGAFTGSLVPAPILARAVPISNDQLLLTFSDPAGDPVPMGDDALLPSSYALTPGLTVVSVEFDQVDGGADRSAVVLTTNAMGFPVGRASVTGATTFHGQMLLDPRADELEFHTVGATDSDAPYVTTAYAADPNTVILLFSEPVRGALAPGSLGGASFALAGPGGTQVSVNSFAAEQRATRARLTVDDLAPGIPYTLTLAGITDTAGNPLQQLTSAGIVIVGPDPIGTPDTTSPRVTGAVATSPTSVLVTFTEPMRGGSGGAEDPSRYGIASLTAGGAGSQALLTVTGAALAPDGRSVTLTTLSQSEIEYGLKVVGVADLAGNLVVPPDRDNPYQVQFHGMAASGPGVDSDGDGLSDAAEQRGWTVVVRRADGTITTTTVTSDPLLADTDGDGLTDLEEKTYLTNPRSADTDSDQLSDYWELNYVYSDPTAQDTDDDGLIDGLEWWFFRTSPNLADTDGDQIDDGDEINFGNRNPRLADLPLPGIEVGAVDLQLDVRFSATSQRGTRELESATFSSTLSQSESRSTSNTDSNTQEFMVKAGVELGWKAGVDFGASGKFSVETGYTGQWSSSFTSESARETQNAYERSTQTDRELQVDESLTREVQGAAMRLTVSLRNLGDIAFNISDIQVSAFILDQNFPGRLVPIATLTPENEPAGGYNLGPLVPERGPLVFISDQVFPSLVEQLMRNPNGLVFKISNFDVTDEFGRNFAFTSQDVNDRTATVVIDYGAADSDGDGEGDVTERLKVSTSAGRPVFDANGDGVIDDDDRILFDDRGRQVGITLAEALEEVLGLDHYDEDATPTASLNPVQLANSYSTRVVGGVERLWRIRTAARELGNPLKAWAVLTPEGIVDNTSEDVRSRVLGAGEGITLAYVQDLDDDGLPASIEYMLSCSDTNVDTDGDGLTDRFEAFEGWRVSVIGKGDYTGYSSCSRTDTDLDGLSDAEELTLGTDAQQRDTDKDGLTDREEVRGFTMRTRGGVLLTGVITDPLNPDSDGDTLPDGAERALGTNPNVNDGDLVFDDDGDTLVNAQEDDGWTVTYYPVSTTPYVQPTAVVLHVTSARDLADTDGDGLRDDVEFQLGTNPRLADTDGDGLTDLQEVQLGTDPLDADTDDDLLSDGVEVNTPRRIQVTGAAPYTVHSDPLVADVDLDNLVDGQEVTLGTDPTKYDTDGDGASDTVEAARMADADPNNNTDPLVRDQLLRITYEMQGVRTSFNNICGEAGGGNAYVTGNFYYSLVGVTHGGSYSTGGKNLGTDYVSVRNDLLVLTAAQGATLQAYTTGLTRWDGAIGYTLQNFSQDYLTSDGLFDSIKQNVFRQTQASANPEDCVVNIRFTITPINN